MSMTTVPYEPAGAAIDHGLVPIAFSRPPQGAIAGLALVARKATQPASAALRVKYAAVPKWFELRTEMPATPCARARSTPVATARSARTWPMPSWPSRTTRGPVSVTVTGSLTVRIAPLRRRATYQGSRRRPCEEWPHSSATTRLSASSSASRSGTPRDVTTRVPNSVSTGASTVYETITLLFEGQYVEQYTEAVDKVRRSDNFGGVRPCSRPLRGIVRPSGERAVYSHSG